jgi:hypothetical protein
VPTAVLWALFSLMLKPWLLTTGGRFSTTSISETVTVGIAESARIGDPDGQAELGVDT